MWRRIRSIALIYRIVTVVLLSRNLALLLLNLVLSVRLILHLLLRSDLVSTAKRELKILRVLLILGVLKAKNWLRTLLVRIVRVGEAGGALSSLPGRRPIARGGNKANLSKCLSMCLYETRLTYYT